MRRSLLVLLIAAVAMPATASAGGFATVGLAPPPPSVGAGDPWRAEMTILQHGVTPLNDMRPVPVLKIFGGDRVETVKARPTGKGGIWTAEVAFPSAGEWSYAVRAFGATHSFAPVTIDRPAAPDHVDVFAAVGALADWLRATW